MLICPVGWFCRVGGRHLQKTDLTMLVGSKIDYDEASDMTSQSWWTSNQIMSCLQFYDVALNEAQVKRTMNLCKSEGMHMRQGVYITLRLFKVSKGTNFVVTCIVLFVIMNHYIEQHNYSSI